MFVRECRVLRGWRAKRNVNELLGMRSTFSTSSFVTQKILCPNSSNRSVAVGDHAAQVRPFLAVAFIVYIIVARVLFLAKHSR